MKITILFCATMMLFLGATVDSEPATPQPQTALAALQTVQTKNAAMIASQVKTLATLDQLSKDSLQLKNFARRL